MLTEEQLKPIILEEAYRLLGLGEPDKLDMKGFNKPDWHKMVNLLPSLSVRHDADVPNEIYHFIAETLYKYERQIGEPFSSWIQAYVKQNVGGSRDYYRLKYEAQRRYKTATADVPDELPEINSELKNGWVINNWNFKPQTGPAVVAKFKTIPGVTPNKIGYGRDAKWNWNFPLINIEAAIEILSEIADVSQMEFILESNIDLIQAMKAAQTETKNDEIVVHAEEYNGRVKLTFPYDNRIIDLVRATTGRRWHSVEKFWTISYDGVEELYWALCDLDDVDCHELEDFIPEQTEQEAFLNQIDLDKYQGLFDHQKTGVKFLLKKPKEGMRGALLGDDMGLGKTRQAVIAAGELLMNSENGEKNVVVSPSSLKLNWEREIKMVYPGADIYVVNSLEWNEDLAAECSWIVVNYDLLKKFEDQVLALKIATLIADEAHYIKNKDAIRSKVFLGYKAPKAKSGEKQPKDHPGIVSNAERVILLTGTPITSRPLDLFNLLKAINHPLAANWMNFVKRYCNAQRTRFGLDVSGSSNLPELHRMTQNAILRRTKEEALDLPEKIRSMIPVEIDLTTYRNAWKEYKQKLAQEGRILRAEHLAMMAKLRMACAIGKIPACIEMAEDIVESTGKVVIFTNFTEVVDRLMNHFGESAVKVVGGMSDAAKQASVDAFQNNPKIKVFVGNIKAAGVGLTLTAAQNEIFNDYSFVPSDHLQAEDRAYRIGQKNAVTVTYLNAAQTIDEDVSEILAEKLVTISLAIEGKSVEQNDIFGDLVRLLWGNNSMIG